MPKVESPKVIYICDRQACEKCNDGSFCDYTSDIEHAANFKYENGTFVEREATEHKELLADIVELLRENRRLKEWRFEHCKHRTGWCVDKSDCEHCEFAKLVK